MKFNDRAVCTFSSGLFAGFGTAINIIFVPAIKASGDPLPSWKQMYKSGTKYGIALVAASTGLAIKAFAKTEDPRYLLSAGCIVLVVPYTYFMNPVNDALLAVKNDKYRESEEEQDTVRKLITKWDKMHYGRTVLGLLAFGINVWILAKKLKN